MLVPILAAALTLTGPQVGKPAPDFQVISVEGKRLSLADFRGKTLVLNVWGSWCPPCREETPDLNAAARRAGRDVAFLGVDTTEKAPIVRAFSAAKGVPYQQSVGSEAGFAKAYDITAFPTTLVIDRNGVLRARFVGNVDVPTLAGFIADARAGRDAVIASKAQHDVDALLDPAAFPFTGDPASIRAQVKAAQAAFDKVDATEGVFDLLAAQRKQSAIRDTAIAALTPMAATNEDKAAIARFQGESAAAREDWLAAVAAFRTARELVPNDPDILDQLGYALGKTKDYAGAAAAYAAEAAAQPSPEAYVQLADTELRANAYDAGVAAYAKAFALANDLVRAKPGDAKAQRKLAWTFIKSGRFYTKAGKTAEARAAFDRASLEAAKLPTTDVRYAMYLEQAQEERVALDVTAGGRTTLSVAPWTGPDLPGSIASTLKYRLVVAGSPGRTVALTTSALPPKWIASFCTDRVCAPFRTTVSLPASGVKVIEFQLVPPRPSAVHPAIRVTGDGAAAAVPG